MYLEGGENLNFAIPVNDAKLLLSNQSAKLQNLPNEAEPKEAPPKESPGLPLAGQDLDSPAYRQYQELLTYICDELIGVSGYYAEKPRQFCHTVDDPFSARRRLSTPGDLDVPDHLPPGPAQRADAFRGSY